MAYASALVSFRGSKWWPTTTCQPYLIFDPSWTGLRWFHICYNTNRFSAGFRLHFFIGLSFGSDLIRFPNRAPYLRWCNNVRIWVHLIDFDPPIMLTQFFYKIFYVKNPTWLNYCSHLWIARIRWFYGRTIPISERAGLVHFLAHLKGN